MTHYLSLQVLDLHAEKVMYQTVLVADTTLTTAASAGNAPPACHLNISAGGLAAASAALSVLQAAATAGAASARLLLPQGCGSSIGTQVSGGLPGMLRSWAAETGAAVVAERQQTQGKMALVLTDGSRGQQPAFTEQESR